MQIVPSLPTLVITEFGTVSPARKLRFDAFGMAMPGGNTVAKPSDLAPVTVTFKTTAPALIGTPARPPTFRVTTENAAWAPIRWNWPSMVSPAGRLSSTRAGTESGVNALVSAKKPAMSTMRWVALEV
jgi:hypothetical protein